jgi:hypothetical protein
VDEVVEDAPWVLDEAFLKKHKCVAAPCPPWLNQGVLKGYSRGARGVLEVESRGAQGVLKGCLRGARGLIKGYSRGTRARARDVVFLKTHKCVATPWPTWRECAAVDKLKTRPPGHIERATSSVRLATSCRDSPY